MGKSKVRTNRDIPGILVGALSAILICILCIAALTHLALTEKIGEKGVEISIPILLLLSSLIGCQVAANAMDKKRVLGSAVTSVTLVLVAVIAGLTMDGAFNGVLLNIGAIVAGGAVSCVLCLKKASKSPVRKKRYR